MDGRDKTFLASLAVFRELYNKNKDIYEVIWDFILSILQKEGKLEFTSTLITKLLKVYFDFDIPEAIVKTVLNRKKKVGILSKNYGIYNITQNELRKKNEIGYKITNIENEGFNYIENKLKKFLADNKYLNYLDFNKVLSSLYNFLLDKNYKTEYYDLISYFLIKNENDERLRGYIQNLKEGLILYTGLKYVPEYIHTSWEPLTIFLDIEILFDAIGYNGEIYKIMFFDFYNLVNEINKQNKKNIIKLKYFDITEHEIINYFTAAEKNFKTNYSYMTKPATKSIIDGCKDPADIKLKQAKFFNELNNLNITKSKQINILENSKYNLLSKDLLDIVQKKYAIENPYHHLKILNFIHILRKANFSTEKKVEDCKFLFLTRTKELIFLSNNEFKQYHKIPLAFDLYYLTNYLWLKANKGFGNNKFPNNIDAIYNAKIILSKYLTDSIEKIYRDLVQKFKNQEISEEDAALALAYIKEQSLKPEDIYSESVDNIFITIKEENIEKVIREKDLLTQRVSETEKRKKEIEIEKEELEKRLEEIESELKIFKINEEKRKRRKEIILNILKGSFFLLISFIGVWYLVKYRNTYEFIKKTSITIISFVASVLGILQFFGIGFSHFKKFFSKRKSKLSTLENKKEN